MKNEYSYVRIPVLLYLIFCVTLVKPLNLQGLNCTSSWFSNTILQKEKEECYYITVKRQKRTT